MILRCDNCEHTVKRDRVMGWKHAVATHDSHCRCRMPEARDSYDAGYDRGSEDWDNELAQGEEDIPENNNSPADYDPGSPIAG